MHRQHEARERLEVQRRLVPPGGGDEVREYASTEPVGLECNAHEFLQERLHVGGAGSLGGHEGFLGPAQAVGDGRDGGADPAVDAIDGGEESRRGRESAEERGKEGGVDVAEPQEGELERGPPVPRGDDPRRVLACGGVERGPVRLEVSLDGRGDGGERVVPGAGRGGGGERAAEQREERGAEGGEPGGEEVPDRPPGARRGPAARRRGPRHACGCGGAGEAAAVVIGVGGWFAAWKSVVVLWSWREGWETAVG